MSNSELSVLLAKQAITEVLYRYCRGLDRMDRDLAASVWHPGGTADYGPDIYVGTGAGFVDWIWGPHARVVGHSHEIANVIIEVSGDRAASESYVTVSIRHQPQGGRVLDSVSRGRYLDRWSKRDGMWAIDHRQHIIDIESAYEVVPTTRSGARPSAGRRDPQDPSYGLFGSNGPINPGISPTPMTLIVPAGDQPKSEPLRRSRASSRNVPGSDSDD